MANLKWRLIGAAIILSIGIAIAYQLIKVEERLPVYQPASLNPKLVDESLRSTKRMHRIPAFELTDQNGEVFTEERLEGKYYVADFFFTTCPNICKDMAVQKRRLQEVFQDDTDFMFVSHTVQPEVDSVAVMAAYAELQGADSEKWALLTGDKKVIYHLARKAYFAVMTEGDGGESDFIHTENFILVDKEKRLRGFYNGTTASGVDSLIADIAILKKEYAE